jgi:hypothetical protein
VLWLVDRGRYKAESLLTGAVGPEDVSAAKASNTARLCKALSQRTRVLAFDGPVEALPLTAFAGADVVALATDNLSAEVEVGQRCQRLQVPLVQASVHGESLVAQVRLFTNRGGAGACPACGFTADEWAHLNRESRFSCEPGARRETVAPPTMSVSCLCSLAADLACVHILRLVVGLGAPLGDCVVETCGYTYRTVVSPLVRNPECPCEHLAWEQRPAPRPLADCTLGELAAGLAASADLTGVSFAVDGMAFAELAVCEGCRRSESVRRFVARDGPVGRCDGCGGPTRAEPFYTDDPVPANMVLSLLSEPLARLAGAARAVVVRGPGRALLFSNVGHLSGRTSA